MTEIKDVDTSTIISTGTTKRSFIPRFTAEVFEEILRHNIPIISGTYVLDGHTPNYPDFTCITSGPIVSCYKYTSATDEFFIEKFSSKQNSYRSLCHNSHPVVFMVHNTTSGKKFGICEGVYGDPGDFSLVKQYIFFPETHNQFEPPRDKCLGRTLKNIFEINHE